MTLNKCKHSHVRTIPHDGLLPMFGKEMQYPSHCEAILFRWIARTCQNSCLQSIRRIRNETEMHRTTVSYNAAISAMGATVKVWLARFSINLLLSRWARRQCSVDTGTCTFIRGWDILHKFQGQQGTGILVTMWLLMDKSLKDNLLGGLKHFETLLNGEDMLFINTDSSYYQLVSRILSMNSTGW